MCPYSRGLGALEAASPVHALDAEALEPVRVMPRRVARERLAQRARQADGHPLGSRYVEKAGEHMCVFYFKDSALVQRNSGRFRVWVRAWLRTWASRKVAALVAL